MTDAGNVSIHNRRGRRGQFTRGFGGAGQTGFRKNNSLDSNKLSTDSSQPSTSKQDDSQAQKPAKNTDLPLYPPLEFEPIPLLPNSKIQELLIIKNDLLSNFRAQDSYFPMEDGKPTPIFIGGVRSIPPRKLIINWDRIPVELRPEEEQEKAFDRIRARKKEQAAAVAEAKKKEATRLASKPMDIDTVFQKLESKEKLESKKVLKSKEKTDEIETKNHSDEEVEDMVYDDELDEGTDYYQQYFDDDDDDEGSGQGRHNEGPIF